MLATLLEAKESSLRNIAGACPSSAAFLQLLNDATRRLMRRGDWPGTICPIHVCVKSGCVVWPRYCGEVRKINVCRVNVPVKSVWYDFLPYTGSNWGMGGYEWWGPNAWGGWCGTSAAMVAQGKSPVFQDILGLGRLVRAYATVNADIGKTVTIFGLDNNNQPLTHQNADGSWSDGWIITISAPFGSTSSYVSRIDRVLLADMQGIVRLYAYHAADDLLEDIGTYEPGDTNPAFERYKLDLGSCSTSGDCGCTKSVVALVKLKFVPARYDSDLVLIDNLDALKLMMQCCKLEEAGDRTAARQYEQDAIRELNLQLADQSPLDQMPVTINTFSGTGIGFQKMF